MFCYLLIASACFGNQDEGYYVAGVGDELWDNGAACGLLYEVVCTGPVNQGVPQPCTNEAIVVRIVDYNPGATTIINLSLPAFATIANLDAASVFVNLVRYVQMNKLYTSFALGMYNLRE